MTQDSTPIKYILGLHKQLPGYPSQMDVLYEVCSHLAKSAKTEFSEQTLNSLWYDEKGSGNWKSTAHERHINDMIANATFREIKNINGKAWYVVDKNPFL